jgi:hypothetical protein
MNLKLLFFALGLLALISCEKDCPSTPTVIVKTKDELLTAKTWKAEEIRTQFTNGNVEYYKRGGANNSIDFDSDSIKLNADQTGIFYYLGTQQSVTWNFTNSEKSKLTCIINYPSGLVTIYWENVTIADSYISYSQFVTSGSTYLSSCRFVPN